MSDRLWLGVDIGTQSVKCVIVDDDGAVSAHAASPLSSSRRPGVHVQDPREWIRATTAATASAAAALAARDRSRIAGLATCSTSGTFAVVDRGGNPRGDGVMYDDRRGSMVAALARGDVGDGERFAHQADVVAAAMVGYAVPTDWSHALKSGYDAAAGRWRARLAGSGLGEELLPAVVSPGTVLGTVGASWAEATGIPRGVPVHAGMTDGCAAQIGAGTVAPGDVHVAIGTTMVFKTVTTLEVDDATSGLYSHRSPDGLWYPGAASNAGAAPLGDAPDLDVILEDAHRRYAHRPGDIPTAYPSGLEGERFPFADAGAVGSIWSATGIRSPLDDPAADPVDRVAAILLGIACVERMGLERLSAAVDVTGTLSSSGGASANRWLARLRADVLDRDVRLGGGSGGAIGMAALACWAAGGARARLAATTGRMVAAGAVFRPTADRGWADDAYDRFRARLREASWS